MKLGFRMRKFEMINMLIFLHYFLSKASQQGVIINKYLFGIPQTSASIKYIMSWKQRGLTLVLFIDP